MEQTKGILIDILKVTVGVLVALKINDMINSAKIVPPTKAQS